MASSAPPTEPPAPDRAGARGNVGVVMTQERQMTDRQPGEPITVGAIKAQEAGGIVSLYEKTDGGHEVVFPLTDAHALAAAITTLAAVAGHPAPVAGVAVKPLEWEENYTARGDGTSEISGHKAKDCFGDYYVITYEPDGFMVDHRALIGNPVFASPEEAKDNCQADYDARIRSALAPQDTVALVERLATKMQSAKQQINEWFKEDSGTLQLEIAIEELDAALAAARAWQEGK